MDIARGEKTDRLNEWSETLGRQLKYMYALTGMLSREQFNFKPEPDRWSVGACIEHLNLSMNAYIDIMKPVIKKTRIKAKGEYVRGTIMGRLMLRALRKPGGTYPAPRSFLPSGNELNPETVRDSFKNGIICLQQTLELCEGLAMGKMTMPWPVFKLIRISLAQAFELQILHNDRHFKQAEHVILSKNFPKRSNPNFGYTGKGTN